MTGWGKEWRPIDWKEPTEKIDRPGIDWPKQPIENFKADDPAKTEGLWSNDGQPVAKAKLFGWDVGKTGDDKTIITEGEITDGKLNITNVREATEEDKAWADTNLHGTGFTQDGQHVALEQIYIGENKIPTHDPYTNPGAYLYYECKCGERLDPHTKRFAELNNAAMKAGWKIRWGANSYVPYCVECGRNVE